MRKYYYSLYCFYISKLCYMFFAPERSGPKNKIKYGQSVYILLPLEQSQNILEYN